jgi:hypothetical protein
MTLTVFKPSGVESCASGISSRTIYRDSCIVHRKNSKNESPH